MLRSALLAALSLLVAPARPQVSFEPVTNAVTTTAGESFGFAWGDMDGDADLDLFVANGNGSVTNDLFRNDGGDAFTEITSGVVANDPGNSTAARWVDIDGDADLDLFVTRRSNQADLLYRNQGGAQAGTEGSFVKETSGALVADLADSRGCAFGDLDGDGDADAVVARASNQADALFLNQGGVQGGTQGAFAKLAGSPVAGDAASTYAAVLADVDGDGDLDLYTANGNGVPGNLYLNGGAAGFVKVAGQHPGTLGSESRAAAFGDLDADGDADLVVGNLLANNFLYLNQGGVQGGAPGSFAQVTTGIAANDGSATLGVALGDHDDDGALDLLVANCCNSDVLLYRGLGAGAQFEAVGSGPFVGAGGYGNACGFVDYDGDLDLDLYVANSSSQVGSFDALYRAQKPAVLVKVSGGGLAGDVNRATDLACGDADGDGDLDVYVPNADGFGNAWFVNQGGVQGGTEGDFTELAGVPPAGGGDDAWAAAFADWDGDGDLDLGVAQANGGAERLYRNAGGAQGGVPGSFVPVTLAPVTTAGGDGRDLAFVDWDGDGDLDLHVVNGGGQPAFQFRNNGGLQGGSEGSFTAIAGALTLAGGDCRDAAWGDVDVDGDLDAFVANLAGDDHLFGNAGGVQGGVEGTFITVTAGPVVNSGGAGHAGAWGDMDGDGDLDLFVANGAEVNFLFRNQGGAQGGLPGTFVRLLDGPVAVDPAASRRAAWGDVDGDNLPELFVPNVGGADDYLYRNLGGGEFARFGGDAGSDGGDSRAARFGDLDGDGDLDLLVARWDEGLALFRNVTPVAPSAWEDLGQGKPGGLGVPQLSGQGGLVAAGPVGLELAQAARSAAVVFVLGFSAPALPFKGGTLVPAPDLVLPGFVTDAAGQFALATTWPAGVPSGFTFYVQALVADAAAAAGLAHSNALAGSAP